jgi:hypothetical protein
LQSGLVVFSGNCLVLTAISAPARGGAGVASHDGADEAMAADLVETRFNGRDFPVPPRAAIEASFAAMGVDLAQPEGRIVDLSPWWQQLDGLLGSPR